MTVRFANASLYGISQAIATTKQEPEYGAQTSPVPTEPPGEIKAIIGKVLNGFNNKDSALYASAFGGDAVIIDGIAPYRWTSPNAPARWLSDAEKWLHNFGVQKETLVCDRITHAAVSGTHAYVVFSATLTFSLNSGESSVRSGILTLTFAKQGDEWKVGSQAWGRLN